MTESDWLSETEAAALIGVHRATLARLRIEGKGPPCYPIGARNRYRRAEVERWLDAQRQTAAVEGPTP